MLLYSLRRWPIKAALTTPLLIAHFGVWGWLTWQRIGNPFWVIYRSLGFSSTVLWAVYSWNHNRVERRVWRAWSHPKFSKGFRWPALACPET